jgi:hypothetical protein
MVQPRTFELDLVSVRDSLALARTTVSVGRTHYGPSQRIIPLQDPPPVQDHDYR